MASSAPTANFHTAVYPKNVLDRNMKNTKVFKIWQRLAIARAALEVIEMKQTNSNEIHQLFLAAFHRQCGIVCENCRDQMPSDIDATKLMRKNSSSSDNMTGEAGWRMWKDTSKEILNDMIPLWNQMIPLPSGKQYDDLLLEFREKYWEEEKEKSKKSGVVEVVDDEVDAGGSTATSNTRKANTSQFRINDFPLNWMVFIHLGPLSPYQPDIFIKQLTNGPSKTEEVFKKELSRSDQ